MKPNSYRIWASRHIERNPNHEVKVMHTTIRKYTAENMAGVKF